MKQVIYATMQNIPAGHVVIKTDQSLDDAVEKAKQAIAQENMWLINEINPQILLQKSGYDIYPARQLLFFHPDYMAELLSFNPHAVIEVPLKIVFLQNKEGEILVRYKKPSVLFTDYPTLAPLSEKLELICARILWACAN